MVSDFESEKRLSRLVTSLEVGVTSLESGDASEGDVSDVLLPAACVVLSFDAAAPRDAHAPIGFTNDSDAKR